VGLQLRSQPRSKQGGPLLLSQLLSQQAVQWQQHQLTWVQAWVMGCKVQQGCHQQQQQQWHSQVHSQLKQTGQQQTKQAGQWATLKQQQQVGQQTYQETALQRLQEQQQQCCRVHLLPLLLASCPERMHNSSSSSLRRGVQGQVQLYSRAAGGLPVAELSPAQLQPQRLWQDSLLTSSHLLLSVRCTSRSCIALLMLLVEQ
jgi:hypothetical protein